MRTRKEKVLFDVMLGAGLYLIDSLRERLAGRVNDFSARARDGAHDFIETASERASRAADAIRGDDHRGFGTAAALLLGVGVGVGIGMLVAPARGEETRSAIAEKVRDRFSREESAAGAY